MGFIIQLLVTCFLLGIGFYAGMLFEKRNSGKVSKSTQDVSIKGGKKQKEKQRKASKTRSGHAPERAEI
uniref:Uncharacterized protein n=2 Tax=Meloidogyne TaxID=189290 RepID=A0A6V7WBI7_MELEN|nr:unnamed protein product [Meloidogyne enterolobii]